MMSRTLLLSLLAALFLASTQAFVVTPARAATTRVSSASVLLHAKKTPTTSNKNRLAHIATTVAVVISTSPLIALAEDDYEYGAVDAPIGLAWGAGVLAILTALLPVALKGGEEAFEDMKERDKDTFGSKNSDVLKSRKK